MMNNEDDVPMFMEVEDSVIRDFDYISKYGNHHYWRHLHSNQMALSSDLHDNMDELSIVDPRPHKCLYWFDTKAIQNNPPIDHRFIDPESTMKIPVYSGQEKSSVTGTVGEYMFVYFLAKYGQNLRGSYYAHSDPMWRPASLEEAGNVDQSTGDRG